MENHWAIGSIFGLGKQSNGRLFSAKSDLSDEQRSETNAQCDKPESCNQDIKVPCRCVYSLENGVPGLGLGRWVGVKEEDLKGPGG